jgi:hypothetical protein
LHDDCEPREGPENEPREGPENDTDLENLRNTKVLSYKLILEPTLRKYKRFVPQTRPDDKS